MCQASSVVSDSLRAHGLWPARLLCPWDSPGKSTGVGRHCLLQGTFPTQGLNPCLLHVSPAWAGGCSTTNATWEAPTKSRQLASNTGHLISQFWRLEVLHQGVTGAMLPLGPRVGSLVTLPSVQWWLQFLGSPTRALDFPPVCRNKLKTTQGFPGGSDGKGSACHVGDPGSIPGLGRSPGEGNGYPFQYSCLETSTDRGAWQATAHGVTKGWIRLNNFQFTKARQGFTGPLLQQEVVRTNNNFLACSQVGVEVGQEGWACFLYAVRVGRGGSRRWAREEA